jgi:hypothetical protein
MCEPQPASVQVTLYSTSVPALPKVRGDIATLKRILDAKRVVYEEVRSHRAVAVANEVRQLRIHNSAMLAPASSG